MAFGRRLLLFIFYLLAGLSLALFALSVGVWIRSHWVSEAFGVGTFRRLDAHNTRLDDLRIWSAKGGVGIYFSQTFNPANTTQGWEWFHQTDTSMEYPYSIFANAQVDQTRRELGPFKYCQLRYESVSMGIELDNQPRQYLADRSVQTSIIFPYWSSVVIALPLPILAARRLLRKRRVRRRMRQGLCPACGYDLRHSPERCPECGRAPKQSAAWI